MPFALVGPSGCLGIPLEWSKPKQPQQPAQDKDEDRITDMDIRNTKPTENGNRYSNFDPQVGANTWMQDVDPEPDEKDEPQFTAERNHTLVARIDIVSFRKNGSFAIEIKRAALDQFDAGTLKIEVSIFDEDNSRDDLYGIYTDTVEYSPSR